MSDAARARLLGILSSTWVAQGLYALAKLGVPDLLGEGERHYADLAAETKADPRTLYRLLRALASVRLCTETAPGTFALTSTTRLLRTDVPGSVHDMAVIYGEEVFRSFAEITHTVRTGVPAFDAVHGRPFYDYLADHPDIDRTFSAAMGAAIVPVALSACDLAGVSLVADLGGGNGGLLVDLLTGHPDLRGVLVELPEAARQARERFAEAGLCDRVEVVEGSFFDTVPPGADRYVLSRVLHNWADGRAADVLRAVRAGMPADSRLIVLEELVDPADSTRADIGDLLLLLMLQGTDRTEAEYRDLLADSGFTVEAVHYGPPPRGESAIVAGPA
jgi:hypothetical protein